MSTQKKLMTLCLATVFTLGLAACGGGGGGSDAPPASGMMDDDVSLEGKYIPSGTTIPGVDSLDLTLEAASGESVDLPGLGTVECASEGGCSGTVADGVLTIMGDLKIVSVDPALDSGTAMVLAGLAVDMLPPEPDPTPYEMALTGIVAADTAEAAQAAYDAVKDDVTAAQGEALQEAVDSRTAALATMARAAMQMANLMTAAGGVDPSNLATQADIDTAQDAIDALQGAIDAADDVADTSMYESQVSAAQMAVSTAQAAVDAEGRMAVQMMALLGAASDLHAALAAISGAPTQTQIDDAETALADLNTAIADAEDLDDTSMYALAVASAQGQIAAAKRTLMANMDQEEADRIETERMTAEAMAATAVKLYTGIGAPDTAAGPDLRTAMYGTDDDANDIAVAFGTTAAVNLGVDKKATIAAHHGWQGKTYTAAPTDGDGGTYEAIVYSNVGDATMGEKFNVLYTDTDEVFVDGELNETTTEGDAGKVAIDSFDLGAGTATYKPDPAARGNEITEPGSFHGVDGTYFCTPTVAATGCSATVAVEGLTLDGGVWTFEPTKEDAFVTEEADGDYASYGWWLHKSADGNTFTASAFAADKGAAAPDTSGIDVLLGTATYSGGAAGKYALRSSTGGTNDAGHFTARAMLEADFFDDTITGTIDDFTGANGGSREWTVELMKSDIGSDGEITGLGTDDPENQKTVWTIDGTAAAAAGQWSGALKDTTDTTGVPKVATGTFYSEYGTAGNMVGGFGATKQ